MYKKRSSICSAFLLCILSVFVATAADAADFEFLDIKGAGGVPLNVVAAGPTDAPGILLIHGIGQSYLSWESQFASPIADTFRLVAFDLRGHGNSGKPWSTSDYASAKIWAEDVHAVIKGANLDRPVLVGWSYGTLVAIDYVRHFGSENLSGLNLVGAYGGLVERPLPDSDNPEIQALTEMRKKQYALDINHNIEASKMMADFLTAKTMPDEWRQRAAMIGLLLPPYARQAMWARPLDNADIVDVLDLPVLLTVGAQDRGAPVELGEVLLQVLPDSHLSVYPNTGHSPFVEDSVRFNNELMEFAAKSFSQE